MTRNETLKHQTMPLKAVTVAAALLLTSGCTYNKATTLKGPIRKGVLVAPVKGPAIRVMYQHTSVVAFGGLLGSSIEGAASETFRAELAKHLNQEAAGLEPDRILAEESAKLLKASSRVSFREVALSPETIEIEEAKALLQSEPRPFTPESNSALKAILIHRKWLKSPPRGSYGLAPAALPETLVLETLLSVGTLNLGKKVELTTLFRLVDPSTGKVLGTSRFVINSCEIEPIKEKIDLNELERGFRGAAKKTAAEALKLLKLM